MPLVQLLKTGSDMYRIRHQLLGCSTDHWWVRKTNVREKLRVVADRGLEHTANFPKKTRILESVAAEFGAVDARNTGFDP